MSHSVGTRAARVDSFDKVTGRARFGTDLSLPGMLHGAVLRSPHPHARIVAIDTTRAREAPGVAAVVTGEDFPFLFGASVQDQPFLAIDRVRYVGEPVVAVAAETELQAQAALGLISVEYEELPPVLDPRDALGDDAPLLHPDLHTYRRGGHEIIPHSNVNTVWRFGRGDLEAGFAAADLVVEDEYTSQAVSHAAIEPHVAIAAYDLSSGGYTVWTSTDRPFHVRDELVNALSVQTSQVRLLVGYVGGSFGGKCTPVADAVAVALARFTGGRPVRVEFSREEDLTASQTRARAILKLKTGVTTEGRITARSAELLWDSGAYTANTVGVAIRGASSVFGPYRIPNVGVVSRLVYTNNQISGPFRGYGVTQVTWAGESQLDDIAARLGIDPLALRLKNGYAEGDTYINGQILHGFALAETLERAAAEIGWGEVERSPAPHLRRGKGIAATYKPTATPTSTDVVLRVDGDGQVTLLCAAPEIGAGQETVLAQMAADSIGVPLEAVRVPPTDTALTPFNAPVASSRTTFHAGNAILAAGAEVRDRILEMAAEILEADPVDLELSDGIVRDDSTGRTITLADLLRGTLHNPNTVVATARYSPAGSPLLKADPDLEWMSSIFWMVATQAVEIEVDIETGVIRVLKVAAAHDVGRPINPMTCEQQIEGGVIMGLSLTLFEDFKTREGRILNGGFTDYKLATIEDAPEIVPMIVESMHHEAPFGAKGLGEPAAAMTAPAIANALFDAIGIRIKDTPLTPERVLAAIRDADRS